MKKVLMAIIVIAVIVVAIVAIRHKAEAPTTTNPTSAPVETTNPAATEPAQNTTSTNSSAQKTFTLADVAKHAVDGDCYAAINGVVYDLTAWVHKHPGGDKNILRICGKDGSAAFDNQHGSDTKPQQVLAGFEIGTLVQ